MKWIYKFSFYYRIQILFILFILLPIIISAVISYVVITREVTGRIGESSQQIIMAMETDLTRATEDITFSANFFASNPDIHDTLKGLKNTTRLSTFAEYEAYQDLSEYINLIEAKMINLRTKMFVVNPEDFVVFTSNSFSMDEIQNDWHQLKEHIDFENYRTMQWLGPIRDEGVYPEYYTARVIRHRSTGEQLGTLIIALPSSYFEKVFGITNLGSLSLYDVHNERIVHRQDPAFVQSEVVISEEWTNRYNWRIGYEISSNEVTGKISSTFLNFFILIGLCVIILMLISVWLARGLNRPLTNLQRVARKFGGGNLSVRFPVRGRDEIAVLGEALNAMLDQIQQLIISIEHEQEEKRVIELQSLFAQIQPHFLINTLNSVKLNLIMSGDELHSKQLDALMNLLRGYMKVHEPGTFMEECRLIGHYLEIMQMRSEMEIRLTVDVPEALQSFLVPRLLLQPIVENAVVHGFVDRHAVETPSVHIAAEQLDDEILLSVSDNGSGMTEEECAELNSKLQHQTAELQQSYKRVGLLNVVRRLRLTYGVDSSLQIHRNKDACVTFVLRIRRDFS